MKYALKFPGRTRQKKYLFSLLFITLFFIAPSIPSINPSGVQASESITSSVASPNSVGSAASEEKNTDSFNVHPTNRWTEENVGYTTSVIDSLLNITDVGDGSIDYYSITRDIRDLSGTIEVHFYFVVSSNTSGANDRIYIELREDHYTNGMYLDITDIRFNTSDTKLIYYDINGFKRTVLFSLNEDLIINNWYTIKISYDVQQSKLRWRGYFDNGTKIFDYDWYEIGNSFPEIFQSSSLQLKIKTQSKTNGKTVSNYIDYIVAPFKEREWIQTDTPSDGQWLADNWDSMQAEDDIDPEDESEWRLTVPYLDSISAELMLQKGDPIGISDELLMYFRIYNVDADDGDLHEVMRINLDMWGSTSVAGWQLFVDTGSVHTSYSVADEDWVYVRFRFALFEDRSKARIQVEGGFGEDATTLRSQYTYTVDISDCSVDPSQEFVFEVNYHVDLDVNTDVQAMIFGYSVIERDIFSDIGGFFDGVIGAGQDLVSGGTDIFTTIFKWVVSVITDFLGLMLDLLVGGLTALGSLLNSVITELQGLAAATATAIWDGIETTLDFLFDAIDGIWNALILILDDIIGALLLLAEDVADFLFALIEFLVVLLLDIIEQLWMIIEGLVFFIWDAIGLPDALALGSELLVYLIELVDWLLVTFLDIVDFFNDLSWLILVIWWAWAIPVQWARAEFNPIGGIANFVEVYFYDALPWSVIGVHIYIPQGIIFTLWLLLLLPGDFALFTAIAG